MSTPIVLMEAASTRMKRSRLECALSHKNTSSMYVIYCGAVSVAGVIIGIIRQTSWRVCLLLSFCRTDRMPGIIQCYMVMMTIVTIVRRSSGSS